MRTKRKIIWFAGLTSGMALPMVVFAGLDPVGAFVGSAFIMGIFIFGFS